MLAVVWGALVVPASAGTIAETCHGLPATIVGTDGNDHLTGTPGDDVVWLGDGNDGFQGGGGNDTICGGPGKDGLYGGAGDDWIDGQRGGDYSLVGGEGDDIVHGGPGDERGILSGDEFGVDAVGDTGSDQVFGDDGDDMLKGEPGMGEDTFDGGPGTDTVSYYLSGGPVSLDVGRATATGADPGDAVDHLAGIESYWGSEFADVLRGSAGDDVINGIYGDDVVRGRHGDDTLTVSAGTVYGGGGEDTFVGWDEGSDGVTVYLGRGGDTAVIDTMRNSKVFGQQGHDVFAVPNPVGGADADRTLATHLDGGIGHDRLTFADNSHRVRILVKDATAQWSNGTLTFSATEEFVGSRRGDTLVGSRRADRLFGAGGDDVLKGLAGADRLVGGSGRDTANGGPGRDTCQAERRTSC